MASCYTRSEYKITFVQVDSNLATALKAALVGQKPLQAIKEGRLGGSPDKMAASKA